MLKLTWRNLMARKVRLVMSTLAIVLGIGFLTGVLTFSGGLNSTFDNIVKGSTSDAVIQPKGTSANSYVEGQNYLLKPRDINKLKALPEVAYAAGSVDNTNLRLLDKDGKLVTTQGAPTIATVYDDQVRNILGTPMVELVEGRGPTAKGEITLDSGAAERGNYKVGDQVTLIPPAPATDPAAAQSTDSAPEAETVTATLVGIADLNGGGMAGAILVMMTTDQAQELFLDGQNAFTAANLTAKDGVSQTALVNAARKVLPAGFQATTGDKQAKELTKSISQFTNVISTFLLVFAVVAVVVGGFIIANTFSILVAQRVREVGLLRALGASRRQITVSVLAEALMMGFIGSTVGIGLGLLLARALAGLFSSFGLSIDASTLSLSPSTLVTGYLVGLLITLASAYLPARRASRIPPIAAMREDAAMSEGSMRLRAIIGGSVFAIGIALALAAAFAELPGKDLIYIGVGSVLTILAAAWIAAILGAPVLIAARQLFGAVFGVTGRLAGENALRNPKRTGATASALMIGLALVSAIGVLAASLNKTIDSQVNEAFAADYLVTSADYMPFPSSIGNRIEQTEGVGSMTRSQFTGALVDGKPAFLAGVDDNYTKIYDFTVLTGTTELKGTEGFLTETWSKEHKVAAGGSIPVAFSGDKVIKVKIMGIIKDTPVANGITVTNQVLREGGVPPGDSMISINAAPGVDKATLKKALDDQVEKLPIVSVQDKVQYADTAKGQVNNLLFMIYGLLALAIIIAVLGIINTLGLSVIERTREIGLLRAVGMRRSKLRRMIALESIAIAAMGAVLGLSLGLGIGVILRAALSKNITELGLPVVSLIVFLVIAVLFGVLAAIVPAIRASRLKVLDAIATE